MIDQILYSALGTIVGVWAIISVFAVVVHIQRDKIKGKVDDKVDEKKEEIMKGMFQ